LNSWFLAAMALIGQGVGFAQAVFQAEHAGALDAVGDHAGAQGFQRVEAEAG
jgi:hypothetical protein